jgi:FkbM family methyltransferase
MKKLINKGLGPLGYVLAKKTELARLLKAQVAARDLAVLSALPHVHAGEILDALPDSMAQLRQDLFVLSELGFKRGGFFVEFGAANGKELSNTWLLEKRFGWSGILAEPARCWHGPLAAHRGCAIEHDCVWKTTGETLEFLETAEAELATLADYQSVDMHAKARRSAKCYGVKTVSLADLLARHHAPAAPDYLSIDTEGSEYEILREFDFARHPFKVITCEHNHTSARAKIFELLTRAGYVRKFEALSDFDDWYVRA